MNSLKQKESVAKLAEGECQERIAGRYPPKEAEVAELRAQLQATITEKQLAVTGGCDSGLKA